MGLGKWFEPYIGGRSFIIALGGLFVALIVTYPVLPSVNGAETNTWVVLGILSGIPALVLVYGGYRLPSTDIRPDLYPTISKWCLRGIAVGLAVLLPITLASDDPNIAGNMLLLTALGSLAGFGAGRYDARAKTRQLDLEETVEQLETANERLERYQQYTDDILDAINDVFYVLDENGSFKRWNQRLVEVSGYTDEKIASMTAADFFEGDDRDAAAAAVRQAFERGSAHIELDLRTSDGEALPFEFVGSTLEDPSGDPVLAGIGRDVTDRVEREQELQRVRERMEFALDATDAVVWDWNADTDEASFYPSAESLYGTAIEDWEDFIDVIHPEDRPRVQERIETSLETGEPKDEEIRIVRDGGVRWIEAPGQPVQYDDGPTRMIGVARDITDRKEVEQDLRESETRFRMLAENLEEVVWISDPNTREILYVNPAFEEIWGRDREVMYDEPTTFLDDVHPDDRERVTQAYEALPEERFDEEYRIVRPDGEVRWLAVRADTVRNDERERVVGIADDITERKERERALEESERRYRTLAENFPNGAVGLYNEGLEYTAVGGQLLDATGVQPEDRLGSSVYDIYPDKIVEQVDPYFHAALDGEANSFEVEFHDRHLRAHTLPVRNADDEVFAGMLVVQDITEQREYERKLEESNERLEQFAYAASHDLQEPLRMVSSYLQLVEDRYVDELDEDGQEFIEFAVDGAERMRAMIEGLLQYSRVDTRGDPFEPVDLNAVLADVRRNLEVKIEESDAEVTAEDLPEVHGDGSQLNQVFQNLLDNAIEYSGDDLPRVHIDAERDGDQWEISVRDEGVGIDPGDADRVFEVFESLQGHEDAGTGIGLALVERIVERHGGDIWVESEPGEGATFSFTLPAVTERGEG